MNKVLAEFATNDNIEGMKLAVEYGADNFDRALLSAVRENKRNASELAIEYGATNFADALLEMMPSIEDNPLSIEFVVEHWREWAAKNEKLGKEQFETQFKAALNKALAKFAANDNIEEMRLAVEYGADNFDRALLSAVRENKRNASKLAIEYGATNFEKVLLEVSSEGGGRPIRLAIKLWREWAAESKKIVKEQFETQFKAALNKALPEVYNSPTLRGSVRTLLGYGADNYEGTLMVAARKGESVFFIVKEWRKWAAENEKLSQEKFKKQLTETLNQALLEAKQALTKGENEVKFKSVVKSVIESAAKANLDGATNLNGKTYLSEVMSALNKIDLERSELTVKNVMETIVRIRKDY